jgi:hypothetical protein
LLQFDQPDHGIFCAVTQRWVPDFHRYSSVIFHDHDAPPCDQLGHYIER